MTKWIKLTGLFVLGAWFLSSCSLDNDEPPYSGAVYWGSATVLANEKGEFELILDNNTVLEIAIPMNPYPPGFTFRENQRVNVSFLILDQQTVQGTLYWVIQVNNIEEIPSKLPVYSSQLGSTVTLGNDPIDVSNKWFSINHLNIKYDIMTGDSPTGHSIDLLVDEDHEGADENNIYVQIRHNANGDRMIRMEKEKYISFDIRKFLPEGKNSVNVHIQYTRYDGQVVRDYNNVYARKKAES